MMSRSSARSSAVLMTVAMLIIVMVVRVHAVGEKTPLRIGFLIDMNQMDGRFTEKDVVIATEILFKQILMDITRLEPEYYVYKTEQEFLDAIDDGQLDYIEISPLIWLRLPKEKQDKIHLLSVIQMGQKRLERFLLVAPQGETLESLAGKRIRVDRNGDRKIGRLWLESEVKKIGGGGLNDYFGKVELVNSAEQLLLPTFFGKADACLVKEDDYRVAVELNPQIGARLAVLATSAVFPMVLTAATGARFEDIIAEVGSQPINLMSQRGARQAFDLLKVKGMTPFEEGDLGGLRDILSCLEEQGEVTKVEGSQEDAE